MKILLCQTTGLALALLCLATSPSYAGIIASWDFDGGTVGNAIVSDIDTVGSLAATPHPSNTTDPIYVTGNGGGTAADFAGIDGVLEVDSSGTLGANFTELNVTFDIDLSVDKTSGTSVLIRNGHTDINFNIYFQSNNRIGIEMEGSAGSGNFKTLGPAIDDAAGWQTVSVVWDGSTVQILVDGVAQTFASGFTSEPLVIGQLLAPDAPMGIGGLRRSGSPGSIGQFFDGSIDNLSVSNTAVPEPSSIFLIGLGGMSLLTFRRK